MSLVHEALRKAELEKQRKVGIAPAPPRAVPHPPAQHFSTTVTHSIESPALVSAGGTVAVGEFIGDAAAQKKSSSLLMALIGAVAVVGMVAIMFLVSLATSALQDAKRAVSVNTVAAPSPAPATEGATPKAQTVSASATAPAEASAQAAPEPSSAQTSEPRFKLSGIMKGVDGNYLAIINSRVRSKDQYVDGATIKSIERDRVTLDLGNGQTTVLRLF